MEVDGVGTCEIQCGAGCGFESQYFPIAQHSGKVITLFPCRLKRITFNVAMQQCKYRMLYRIPKRCIHIVAGNGSMLIADDEVGTL